MLYASVGHAGASGYLAAMAIFGIAPNVMKPTALVLNILVAAIATVKFYRAGCFLWSIFGCGRDRRGVYRCRLWQSSIRQYHD